MKKRIGKITILALIAITLAIITTWAVVDKAEAQTWPTQTFVLPSTNDVTHTANTYIAIWNIKTGDLVHASTGTVAAGNDWTDADIATAQHAQNTCVWTATIPPLDTTINYAMGVFSNGTPADDDVPTLGPFLYDPERNITYSDTNPVNRGSVTTKNWYR